VEKPDDDDDYDYRGDFSGGSSDYFGDVRNDKDGCGSDFDDCGRLILLHTLLVPHPTSNCCLATSFV
jgi:hypothetical protein